MPGPTGTPSLSNPYMFPQAVQDRLIMFCKSTQQSSWGTLDLRTRFAYIDREYIRENTLAVDQHTQSKASNQAGNKRKLQDIVIPLVEPQSETMVSYLSSVFLTGIPMFPVVADKENMDEAKKMEAIISMASIRGGWARHLQMFFRDGIKYNFHAVEVPWCVEKIYSLKTDAKFGNGLEGKPTEVLWQGSKVKRLDPYNVIFDARVNITDQHTKAEFVGYVEPHNSVSLRQFLHSLPYRMNVSKAYDSIPQMFGTTQNSLYHVPDVFTENYSGARLQGIMNWDLWGTGGKSADVRSQFKNIYYVVTRYVRIVPSDLGMMVPNRGQVQIWKIITVNDAVIVYMERLSNVHNYLPILFGQPIEDGLNLQTKSFAQKQIPLQDIASALMNSKFAARRRLIADRGLYDPSRIREEDINNENPAAKIPVRPTAYGQDLAKAYYQMPFKDEQTGTIMQDVREVMSYADYLSGQNKGQQGQFQKGNRTKSEYDDVQNKSSGRQQTLALNMEYQIFTPLKEIIKSDILQYQPAGKVYSMETKEELDVDPVVLREKVMDFKVADGLLPSDKLMEGSTIEVALQAVSSSEQLAREYNVGDIFATLMKVRGVDIDQYKWSDQQKQMMHQQNLEKIKAEGEASAAGKVVPNGAPV